MPGTGYYDSSTRTYKSLPVETWASYTDWSTFTSWTGTASDTVTFTTQVYDAGKIDYFNPTVTVEASIPVDIDIYHGNTVDSAGGAIDTPTTVNVTPNTSPIAGIQARYFQFDITVTKDSATQSDPEIYSISVNLSNQLKQIQQSDINTNSLSGSVGQRQLTFNVATGKIVNLLVQPHITGLDDSTGEGKTPIVLIDKSSSPAVLNIFDADTYGKRTRIDCVLDVQATTLPLLESDATGSIVEVND
jgi:hypothetical protein